jgi:N-acetylneuraminate synthase
MRDAEIQGHVLSPGAPCLIVAEVAQAHVGSLGMAHAYVDAVAGAGADAVKFQTHIAAAESSMDEPWRIKSSEQDVSRYDYWRRMEFTEQQWLGLKRHADERGLVFLSSPFSIEAVELLERVGVAAWKVPSGEISNTPMLKRIVTTGLPIVLSTGMSPLKEIDAVVEWIRARGLPLIVVQCTTAYPCPPEKTGLDLIPFFRDRYDCLVGLSDHSGTIYPGLAAATIGVELVEVHVTFHREMFGPDVPASVTMAELRQLVGGIRFIEKMRANPVDKDALAVEMAPLRKMFTQSVTARSDIKAGTVLKKDHLATRKPGTGIPADRLEALIGKVLQNDVKKNEFLREQDFERFE